MVLDDFLHAGLNLQQVPSPPDTNSISRLVTLGEFVALGLRRAARGRDPHRNLDIARHRTAGAQTRGEGQADNGDSENIGVRQNVQAGVRRIVRSQKGRSTDPAGVNDGFMST